MSEIPRLRWRCRRGMKELDLLLNAYLDRCYPNAPGREREVFEQLLELQDPQLFAYLIGRETPTDSGVANVVSKIRDAAHS